MRKLAYSAASIVATLALVLAPSSADAKPKPWHDHKHDAPIASIIDWD